MTLTGFFLRLGFAIVLVLLTYNPSGYSYVHWVSDWFETDVPLKVLVGIAMIIAYAVVLRAAFRSIGFVGIGLVAALLAAIAWVAYDYGLLRLENSGLNQWLGAISAGLILGVGLSWSHIRRMLSGQIDMDDVEE